MLKITRTTLANPLRQPRQLAYLQMTRCPGCPACGALPFELCRNIPGDPSTATRWVHMARLARLETRPRFYGRVRGNAMRRLLFQRPLAKAA